MKLKTTQTIHLFFCMGIAVFGAIVLLINTEKLFFDASLANTAPFNPAFPIFAIIGIITSIVMFRKRISAISPELSFDEKFMHYQTAFLIRCAFCEAGAILNIIGCLKMHNLFFMLFAAASFIALVLSRPTKDSVISNLQLQYPETEKV